MTKDDKLDLSVDESSLVDQLFDTLSEAIVANEYPAGTKLSEPKLSQKYGVSRGPVREAIRRLEERRLVMRTPRQGVRVVSPTHAVTNDLLKIREALEGLAAREAALNASDEDIENLRVMLARHREELAAPNALTYWQPKANLDFHFMIARLSQNDHLFDLLCNQYYPLFRLYRMRHSIVPGRALRALHEHERIVDAIGDRDSELAEILMRRHISAARDSVSEINE